MVFIVFVELQLGPAMLGARSLPDRRRPGYLPGSSVWASFSGAPQRGQ